MTDPVAREASSTPSRRPRRRHPALASRIAVTGMSTATMFGIVAALGVSGASQDATRSAGTDPGSDTTVPAEPVGTTVAAPPGQPTTVPAPVMTTVPVTELSNEPIQLTAEPVVRVVETPSAPAPAPREQAPVASTNGSR